MWGIFIMAEFLYSGRHIGIPVVDINKMKKFYCGLIGFIVKSDEIEEGFFISNILGIKKAKIHVIKMTAPDGWMLELLQYLNFNDVRKPLQRNIHDIGIAHFALTVKNIDKLYFFLKDDVVFISLPEINPSKKAKVCFCQDPEGNYIELVENL